MTDAAKLDQLLDQWDSSRQHGQELAAEQLCADAPALLDELRVCIRRLKATDWLFEPDEDLDDDVSPSSSWISPQSSRVELPDSALTAEEFSAVVEDCELVAAAQLGAAARELMVSHGESARQLAQELVDRGKLTDYQAATLLTAKGDPLRIDRYEILRPLGSGGMGTVYLARHPGMDRLVALKVLPPTSIDSADKIKRFEREGRAVARLAHPNIATAYDAHESAGIYFLVMEYIEGQNLAERVRAQGALTLEEAIDCVLQAARGLEHAHRCGVVHRDVKPANVILAADGTVKVVDLGLAQLAADAEDGSSVEALTNPGNVMGTVAFMSPEQAADTRDASLQSDIYSLGATLYYLLVGKPMYREPTAMKMILAHREAPIPTLSQPNRAVSEELECAYRQMVAKQPRDRFATMTGLIKALERCRKNVATIDASPRTRLPQPCATDAGTLAVATDATQSFDSLPPMPAKASAPPPPGAGKRYWRWLLLGMAPIALATIIIIIRHPDGTESRFKVPSGTDIEIEGDTVRLELPAENSAHESANLRPLFDAPSQQKSFAHEHSLPIQIRNAIEMPLVLIPPGEFLVGSTEAEIDVDVSPNINERPQHRVRISTAFYCGVYEVTRGEFKQVMATNPSRLFTPATDRHPVDSVSWLAAVRFCNALSKLDSLAPYYDQQGTMLGGTGYRLPTEAEWEYACRAGTRTPYWYGADREKLPQYGWAGSNDASHPVGLLLPNPFGLYDMHGNVWEWCQDWYSETTYARRTDGESQPATDPVGPRLGTYKTSRGGSWSDHPHRARSAERSMLSPTGASKDDGFRVVRTVGTASD